MISGSYQMSKNSRLCSNRTFGIIIPTRSLQLLRKNSSGIMSLPGQQENLRWLDIPRRISTRGVTRLPEDLPQSDWEEVMSFRSVTGTAYLPVALACTTVQSVSVQPYSRQVSGIPNARLN